ncbi:threonine/serine exporter family protein [Imhoffiella purpurea]|uniref:Threonine/serine exporter family protein n=1 Tax=Imhoffiella purpurea TaxID=1249627 RepID=W9VBF3_9GAMM|nr:threonine/serine exporter family protein [Imhoffiella purpurea]EXJ14296.1 hypothetical protein D779_2771 [Imhoffiella purpurea]
MDPIIQLSSQSFDDPVDFEAACRAVVRAGTIMASAGTGAYRVKEEMNRVGIGLGLDAVHAEVTLNTVMATCVRGARTHTLVGTIPAVSVNAGRIVDMEALALGTSPGTCPADFDRRLDAIASRPARYGPVMTAMAAMLACGAFCFLNHGGWLECLGAAIGAGAGQWLRATLVRRRLNQLGVTLLAGILACLLYLGVTGILMTFGVPSSRHAAGYTSAVLFLIPGFPLITAALDLARLDFSAGIARLTYAILVVSVASISAWLVAGLVHLVPLQAPELDLSDPTLVTLRLVASFCGVLGFALMFNTPLRIALAASAIGMLANTLRLYLVDVQWPLQLAAPAASLLVGLMAAWVSPRMRCPRIVLSVPPVLIMIPGTIAYQALVYANEGMSLEAIANAYQAMFIVAGIVIGLALARMLTDRAWGFEGRIPGNPGC